MRRLILTALVACLFTAARAAADGPQEEVCSEGGAATLHMLSAAQLAGYGEAEWIGARDGHILLFLFVDRDIRWRLVRVDIDANCWTIIDEKKS